MEKKQIDNTSKKHKDWKELCETITNKILANKGIKKTETKTFKTWFMEREKVGYLFDWKMILRCYYICKELKKNLDHFIVICGREGLGKSTLAMKIAAWVTPNFIMGNVTYSAEHFLSILERKSKEYETHPEESESIIMDEGTELLSRESQNITNKVLIKTFFIQRALRFLVIINIPNFHMLDSVIRYHRTRTLIAVTDRGRYIAYKGKAIQNIAKWGQKDKTVTKIRVGMKYTWCGSFNKDLPKTLNQEAYEKNKIQGIQETITKLKGTVVKKKMVKLSQLAKEIGIKPDSLITKVKNKEIDGKQIGKCWYITKDAYDRVLDTNIENV